MLTSYAPVRSPLSLAGRDVHWCWRSSSRSPRCPSPHPSPSRAAGSVLVKDITPGPALSGPSVLTNVNGVLYFAADDGVHGFELWKSDGTAAGTMLVQDINTGPAHSEPIQLLNLNGTLYFAAADGVHGDELWRSEGTRDTTVLVKDINGGVLPSAPTALTDVNGTLFFTAYTGAIPEDTATTDTGRELWKSDGTAAGTVLVKDILSRSGPPKLRAVQPNADQRGAVLSCQRWGQRRRSMEK